MRLKSYPTDGPTALSYLGSPRGGVFGGLPSADWAYLSNRPAVIAAGVDAAAARAAIDAVTQTDAAGIVYALNLAGII